MATKNIMELVRQKKAALQAQSGRKEKTTKPTPGKNRYRILPGWRENDATFFADFGQHFIKNLRGELQAVYMCAEKTFGKPCAICDTLAQGINNAEDDETLNALKEGKSKGRILMNAPHLDGEDPKMPVILDLTPTTFEKVLELLEEYGDITDLDEGTDVVITRSGKGLNTEYTVMPANKSASVDKSVLKNLHDLDAYVQQEYQEGETKALGAVRAVAGALPAPAVASRSKDVPTTSGPSKDFDDDSELPGSAPAASEDDDVLEGEYEVAQGKPSEPAGEEMNDDELDDLLSDLG